MKPYSSAVRAAPLIFQLPSAFRRVFVFESAARDLHLRVSLAVVDVRVERAVETQEHGASRHVETLRITQRRGDRS